MFVISHARPHALCLAFAVIGCATPSVTRIHRDEPSGHSEEITLEEIKTVLPRTSNAADVIRTLRPGMFDARYPSASYSAGGNAIASAGTIQVYVDNIPYGGIETLRTIPAVSVRSVRRLSAMDAVTRFGGSHMNGVIVVTTGVPDRVIR